MREVRTEAVTAAVRDLFIEANTRLPEDFWRRSAERSTTKESALGREVLEMMLENRMSDHLSKSPTPRVRSTITSHRIPAVIRHYGRLDASGIRWVAELLELDR